MDNRRLKLTLLKTMFTGTFHPHFLYQIYLIIKNKNVDEIVNLDEWQVK